MNGLRKRVLSGILLCILFALPGLADTNPEGNTLIDTTLTSGDCLNLGTIDNTSDYRHGIQSDTFLLVNGPTGLILTSGYNALGILAKNGGDAWNIGGSIITSGDEAYGMDAWLGSTATNLAGSIETWGRYSLGLTAYDHSSALNTGSILTHGADASGLYVGYVSSGSNAGSIVTSGDDAHGMVAWTVSTAENTGSIVTSGENAYGMSAESDSIVINALSGDITTLGVGSHGMVASNDSLAENAGEILTMGHYADGMLASNRSVATNTYDGFILTGGYGSFGMSAIGWSSVYNHGAILTGDGLATGMAARENSTAINWEDGFIFTNGEGARGMEAHEDSLAENRGTIQTLGEEAAGILVSENSVGLNSGMILTAGDKSPGMKATWESRAENTGWILTLGEEAHGMFAWVSSDVVNSSLITTSGDRSFGMMAEANSSATNTASGDIHTNGELAHGMAASDDSLVTNEGFIVTSGDNAYGMRAGNFSAATNSGTITTSGNFGRGIRVVDHSTGQNTASGSIETWGSGSSGMVADIHSVISNDGSIVTHGNSAYGMHALGGSTALNTAMDSIETWGESAYGMAAFDNSTALNTGSITTHGDKAIGMYAHISSYATNSGFITTYGAEAFGMRADEGSSLWNYGNILTEGDGAHGMDVVESSDAFNAGTITTRGLDAHAVRVDNGGVFTNSGTLDSLNGYAVAATGHSQVTLNDGTVLAGSHVLSGDADSSLWVDMSEALSAQVAGFGFFYKQGSGWMTLEDGSIAWSTSLEDGTLEIAEGTQFKTMGYEQFPDGTLYMTADPVLTPLYVETEAEIAGLHVVDGSGAALPGIYTYIDAGSYIDNFDTEFVNFDPVYDPYMPQWFSEGGREYYRGMIAYAFSEQALGLVSAIQDWSLLRWVMGNHLADVSAGLYDLSDGKRHFHFHGLYGKTERDPAGDSPAGFDATQSGVSLGFDQRVNDRTVWGLYAGYTKNDLDITRVAPAASDWENQESWHFGGYVSYRTGNWILTDALTYRTTDHETWRNQLGGAATADFDSWSITNDFRAGYVIREIGPDSNWEIVPEIGFNFGHLSRDGYTEKNGFTYRDFDTTVWESVLGVRFRGEFARDDGSRWVPQLRLSWVHLLSGDDVTVAQGWGGDWHTYTEVLDDDAFVVDLGVSLFTAGNTEFSLSYNGRFSDNSESHGAWLRIMMKF